MSAEFELQPLVQPRRRRAALQLALVAAAVVVALAVGLAIYQSGRDAEALKRFPDRVEILSAGWAPGSPGVVQMKLRLSRKDGQAFDPRSGVTLTDLTPGHGMFHYVRGWTDPRARRPVHEVRMDFQQAVALPEKPDGPQRLEIRGWTQPRIHVPWLMRLQGLLGKPTVLQLTVPLYELENGVAILPPPAEAR